VTAFTDLAGCRAPLQLASLGGPIGTPELAAAVSEAGGLGMIPNPSAEEVGPLVESARTLTAEPIGIGFLIPFVTREAVDAAARAADVVEFFYGDPDPELVGAARVGGAPVGWQIGSAAEARAAEQAGCQYVIAQGTEAGGHVRGTQPLDTVFAETLAEVGIPVIAAGGIAGPERVVALLEADAAAVRIGTKFVAAEESAAHPAYVERLIAASASDTVLTEAFRNGWPDAPHRVLRSAVDAAEKLEGSPAGNLGEGQVPAFAPAPPTTAVSGEIEAMALYAGESVGAVGKIQPASEIVAELTANL
jgi:nitronate monooxygenase